MNRFKAAIARRSSMAAFLLATLLSGFSALAVVPADHVRSAPNASAPDRASTVRASAGVSTSPLATTGMDTASFTARIACQCLSDSWATPRL